MHFKLRYIFSIVLVAIITYCYLIAFPQILFKQHLSYKQFEIYSNKDLDSNLYFVLDSSCQSLNRTDIYDSCVHQKIFFIDDSYYQKLCSFYSKNKLGFHEFYINNTLIVPPYSFSKDSLYFDSKIRGVLHHTITHEIIHSMQEENIGFWGVCFAPKWLLEGNAIYHAKPFLFMKDGKLDTDLIKENRFEIRHVNEKSSYIIYGILYAFMVQERDQDFCSLYYNNYDAKEIARSLLLWHDEQKIQHR